MYEFGLYPEWDWIYSGWGGGGGGLVDMHTRSHMSQLTTETVHTIEEKTIPKTSAVPRKLNKPWWTEECQEVVSNTS